MIMVSELFLPWINVPPPPPTHTLEKSDLGKVWSHLSYHSEVCRSGERWTGGSTPAWECLGVIKCTFMVKSQGLTGSDTVQWSLNAIQLILIWESLRFRH